MCLGRGGPAESALRLASGVSRPRPLPRLRRRTGIPISTVSPPSSDFGAAPAQFDLYKRLSPAACACVNFLRSCRIFGVFSLGSQFCFRAPAVNFKGGHAIHRGMPLAVGNSYRWCPYFLRPPEPAFRLAFGRSLRVRFSGFGPRLSGKPRGVFRDPRGYSWMLSSASRPRQLGRRRYGRRPEAAEPNPDYH